MQQDSLGFRDIIKDYLYEFIGGFKIERLGLLPYIAIGTLYTNLLHADRLNWMGGVPIIFALISGAFHMISLSPMMYLIPYSQKRRENYIQKMLYVKIGFPTCFALVWDCFAVFINPIKVFALILQLIMVVILTYIFGTLNDGTVLAIGKTAYGGIRDFVSVLLGLCYIGGVVLFMICMDSINQIEFSAVLGVMLVVFLPVVNIIRKRWRKIRANFANYEMAVSRR